MFKTRNIFQSDYIHFLWIIVGGAFAFIAHLLTKIGIQIFFYQLIIVILTFSLYHYSAANKSKYEKPLSSFIVGVLVFIIICFFYDLAVTYLRIPKWDFVSFYLFAKVGLSGLNFYDPHVFMYFFKDLNLQPFVEGGFIREIVNVGFWYPPPSMFLFLPLGIFNIKTAYFIWQSAIILFLLADILLLVRNNPLKPNTSHKKIVHIALLSILILFFPGILDSTLYSQTLSIFLFFLIFLIKYIDNWKSGAILTFLIVIKPLAAIFVLYFLFFKKWKILVSFILSGFVILVISIFFFGFDSFFNYFVSPPTSRIPPEIFYETTNASLDAVLLRFQVKVFDAVNFGGVKLLTWILSIVIILITFYSSKIMVKKYHLLSFMIFIPAGLLVYPNTQSFYIILLIPVVLYFFNLRPFNNNALNLLLLLFLYALGHYSLFSMDLGLWLIIVIWSLPPSFQFFYLNKMISLPFKNRNHHLAKN